MCLSRAWRAATRVHGHSSHSSDGRPGRLQGASWQPMSCGPVEQHQNSHWDCAVPVSRGRHPHHPSAPGQFLRETSAAGGSPGRSTERNARRGNAQHRVCETFGRDLPTGPGGAVEKLQGTRGAWDDFYLWASHCIALGALCLLHASAPPKAQRRSGCPWSAALLGGGGRDAFIQDTVPWQ